MEYDVNAINTLWERVAPRIGPPAENGIPTVLPGEPALYGGALLPESAMETVPVDPWEHQTAVQTAQNPWGQVFGATEQSLSVCFGGNAPEEAGTLRLLLEHERREAAVYETMAGYPRHSAGKLCRKLYERQKKLCRRMSAALYLLSGQSLPQAHAAANANAGGSEGLRDRYQAEAHAAAGYRKLAHQTADACLRELFLDTADEKEKAAALFLRLIEEGLA